MQGQFLTISYSFCWNRKNKMLARDHYLWKDK